MDISVNANEVKYTTDEPLLTDNSSIKVLGYFKLFECGKEFFNKLDTAYEHACMENGNYGYWEEMYDTTTN